LEPKERVQPVTQALPFRKFQLGKGKLPEEEQKVIKGKTEKVFKVRINLRKEENPLFKAVPNLRLKFLPLVPTVLEHSKITEETFKPLEELKEEIFEAVSKGQCNLIRYFPIDCDDENL